MAIHPHATVAVLRGRNADTRREMMSDVGVLGLLSGDLCLQDTTQRARGGGVER